MPVAQLPAKIIFIGLSGYEYPHVRVRCYHFARELSRLGFQTEVLSFKDHLAPDMDEARMYALGDRDRLRLVLKSLPRIWRHRNAVLYLQKLHYHTAGALLLARHFNLPFILDYDDYEIGTDSHGSPLFCGFNHASLNRLFYGASTDRAITESIAEKALCCVASSHNLTEFLSGFNDRVFRVPTGVDTSIFRPSVSSDVQMDRPFTFLWTGLVWGQTIVDNLIFLLHALKRVLVNCPAARLRIIGGGDRMAAVKSFAAEQLPVDSVDFSSWVNPETMPGELQKVDVGLLPLIEDTMWTRSKSPTKLFEYLSAGLPVIAHRTGEVRHVIQHGENGFLAGSLDEFVDAMTTLYFDRTRHGTMSRAARRTAEENYSLDILGNRLAGCLRQVLGAGKA
jgi:glycosyltransferase involved in cell wall biosynthesis